VKRTERHHLKDNELVNLAVRVRRFGEERQRALVGATLAILVLVGAVFGYFWWQRRIEARADVMMTEASVVEETPVVARPDAKTTTKTFATERARMEAALEKYKAVADEYPRSDAGLLARYKEAGVLLALDRSKEALAAYQDVVNRAGDRMISQTARLGLAEAHARLGEHDQAIKAYQDAAARTDGAVPMEAVLMQLGRAYLTAGKTEDARQTFSRVVKEFGASPLSAEAQRELDLLNET
jgi:tetratricopeptide (TPR) repeat protein